MSIFRTILDLVLSFLRFLTGQKEAGRGAERVKQSEAEREARDRIAEAEAKPADANTTKDTMYGGRF